MVPMARPGAVGAAVCDALRAGDQSQRGGARLPGRRVAVAMMSQRTNVFCPAGTPLAAFRSARLAFGPELDERYGDGRTALGGVLAASRRHGWDLLPIVAASAAPGGVCDADAYDYFRRIIVLGTAAGCSSREGLDGVVLVLSGSMMVGGVPDPAADLATAVRGILGRRRALVVVVDFLANLSAALVAATDACVAPQTNPTVDARERGAEAGDLLQRMMDSGHRPLQHLVQVPLLAPPIALRTAVPPMADVLALARGWERRAGIVKLTVCGGFPYVDTPEAGLSVVALAESDPELARQAASEVAAAAFAARRSFRYRLHPPSEVLPAALAQGAADPRPLLLMDPADDLSAGAAGDCVHLLRVLANENPTSAVAATLLDPAAVETAARAGVGSQVAFDLGGRLDPSGGPPLRTAGYVKTMGDGRFVSARADLAGLPQDAGRAALLDLGPRGGLRLAVAERRFDAPDPGILRHLGGNGSPDVLLLKGWAPLTTDPGAAWRACIELDGPGLAHPDLTRLPFKRVRRPIYPLDPI